MHHIVLPDAFVHPAVGPLVDAAALDVVVLKLVVVVAAVREVESAPAVLHEVVFESRVVGPGLFALAVLFVVFPVAFVPGERGLLRAVGVGVRAVAVGFVFSPVALVNVAVRVAQSTFAARLVVFLVADVLSAVDSLLLAESLSLRALHLAFVDGAVVEGEGVFLREATLRCHRS